jgi:hypothetical protein
MIQPYEYALMAAGSYDDVRRKDFNRSPIPPDWAELTQYARSGSGPNAGAGLGGFSAKVYKSSSGEIVISYSGTEFNIGSAGMNADFFSGNVPLSKGIYGQQAYEAAKLYQQVKAGEGGNISFTGHSLGGGLASVMAVWFDRPAYVFAAAPFQSSADTTQISSLGTGAAPDRSYSPRRRTHAAF